MSMQGAMPPNFNNIGRRYSEYGTKFQAAYLRFMKALSQATNKYSSKLPAFSNEYEDALSRATQDFVKELKDIGANYKDLSENYWRGK
jgi:hypothetical protein